MVGWRSVMKSGAPSMEDEEVIQAVVDLRDVPVTVHPDIGGGCITIAMGGRSPS